MFSGFSLHIKLNHWFTYMDNNIFLSSNTDEMLSIRIEYHYPNKMPKRTVVHFSVVLGSYTKAFLGHICSNMLTVIYTLYQIDSEANS